MDSEARLQSMERRMSISEEVIDLLVSRVCCVRCNTNPPLDEWIADRRPSHICGKPRLDP